MMEWLKGIDFSFIEDVLFPKVNIEKIDLTDLILDLSGLFKLGGGAGMSEGSQQSGNIVRVEVVAQLFGLTVRRIQQLTQEGIIQTVEARDEKGRACKRYDLIPTIQNYIQYLSDKAYGKAHRTDKEIELREKKMAADIALRESQNELHRLKTAIASGDYISVEEVKLDYARFFVVFKKFATSLPVRVSGMLSGQLDPLEARRIEKEVSKEISELLNSFVIAGVVKPRDVKGILSESETMA